MTVYEATNGIKVDSETQAITGRRRIQFDHGNHATAVEMSGEEAAALIETLDHEKDNDLGRWRWAENPHYVVYTSRRPYLVLNELTGDTLQTSRDDPYVDNGFGTIYNAAAAYFEAHPERKPWEDAKEGQVWIITYNRREFPAIFQAGEFRDHGGSWTVDAITAARRIWPEEVS